MRATPRRGGLPGAARERTRLRGWFTFATHDTGARPRRGHPRRGPDRRRNDRYARGPESFGRRTRDRRRSERAFLEGPAIHCPRDGSARRAGEGTRMSIEALNAVLDRAMNDAAFRAKLAADPTSALAGYDLTDDERSRFTAGTPQGERLEESHAKTGLSGV